MRAIMSADYTRLGIKNYINESYEGNSEDCEKWVRSKMEEVFDFFNKKDFEVITSYRKTIIVINPNAYMPIQVTFNYE